MEIAYSSEKDLPEKKEIQTIEYKGYTFPFTVEELSNIHNLICSWINTSGGIALIGVSEKGENFINNGMHLDSFMKQECVKQIQALQFTPSLPPDNVRVTLVPIETKSEYQKYLIRIDVKRGKSDQVYGRSDLQFNYIRSAIRIPTSKKYKNIKITFGDIKKEPVPKNEFMPIYEPKGSESLGPKDYYIRYAAPFSKFDPRCFLTEDEAREFDESKKGSTMTTEQYLVHHKKGDAQELLKRMRNVNGKIQELYKKMNTQLNEYEPYSRLTEYAYLKNLRELLTTMHDQLLLKKNDEPH